MDYVHRIEGSSDVTYEDMQSNVNSFLELLGRHAVHMVPGGQLERACATLLDLPYRREHLATDSPWPSLRDDLQVAVGLGVLIRGLLECENHPSFQSLVPHLRILADTTEGNPSPAARAPATDDTANKIVELSLGVAACRISNDVEMDDPIHSSGGTNPDVLFTSERGERWGIACKAVHGDAPMSMFQLLEDGVRQIEAAACDTGIVYLTLKNRVPHSRYLPAIGFDASGFPILGSVRDARILQKVLSQIADERIDSMVNHVTKDGVWAALRGKKALPTAIVYSPTTAIIKTPQGPAIKQVAEAVIKPLEFSPLILNSRMDSGAYVVLRQFIHALGRA